MQAEALQMHGSDTGPCFEFLLQQNVVDRLCAMGLADVSAGGWGDPWLT
jgi:hypothetical protein